jgi:site-specific DNA-methyltransferase (adenine-specific)
MIKLLQGDCLELMKNIPDKSIDMILCDLPYGTTQNKWDKIIPFEPLWEQYERIIKDNAAILLFSAQPFTTDLIISNRKMFKYEIIWKKTQKTGFYNAKKAPLRAHENILVFYKKQPTYNPIKSSQKSAQIGRKRQNSDYKKVSGNSWGKVSEISAANYTYIDDGLRYPTDVIEFSNWNGALFGNNQNATKHPTQKPVSVLEYLIRTYTNEGDLVLDNCMGSGSTGVASQNLNRDFIGIELNEKYFEIANKRIYETKNVNCQYIKDDTGQGQLTLF